MSFKRLVYRPKSKSTPASVPLEVSTPQPDPEQAWKALSLVNDWIRHAEAKATAILVGAGVSAGVLYNVLHSQDHPSWILDTVATIGGIFIVAAAGSAIIALIPRLTVKKLTDNQEKKQPNAAGPLTPYPEDPVNLLYFRDIAQHYRGDAPTYIQVLSTLTSDRIKLTEHIGRQVHANSDVAHRKYMWANRATIALAAALAMLGATAGLVARR